ncbi:hypothetical protein [Cognatishimia sp. F0-27]|uniref:hypothetical protein n=1 Tax=Cognatishimia sp. F0-27 TaxID=2816855 RepID=UPI001D0C5E23|nr:hypothetical protein [Cognatishimia sp. F0-27]MCC1490993.1 hypothetical protein [Cognatishimia sp. F0-27]
MIRWAFLSIVVLAGCDTAGPGFRSAEPVTRVVEGSRFTLRFRGDLVEAIRTSPEMLPRFEDVARKAGLAAQAERPGCVTDWVEGDPAVVLLGLSCNGGKAPKRPKRKALLLCDLYDLSTRDSVGRGSAECEKL